MSAVLYDRRDDVRMQTLPEPSAPGPGAEVLKVFSASICGTDVSEEKHGPLLLPRHARRSLERTRKEDRT